MTYLLKFVMILLNSRQLLNFKKKGNKSMDETNLLLKKWRGGKKEEKDKYPCLTCRDACSCSPHVFCAKICTLPLVRMTEGELDKLERRTRLIQIDWPAFYRRECRDD